MTRSIACFWRYLKQEALIIRCRIHNEPYVDVAQFKFTSWHWDALRLAVRWGALVLAAWIVAGQPGLILGAGLSCLVLAVLPYVLFLKTRSGEYRAAKVGDGARQFLRRYTLRQYMGLGRITLVACAIALCATTTGYLIGEPRLAGAAWIGFAAVLADFALDAAHRMLYSERGSNKH